ncbi:MAG TPA: hypothetical protein VFV19_16575 [Candidatus Polarisedimenticolaceae bacterium]|nr:hypothetical protein [Candidatus Polarisedimenticolaceae bacterium]
MKLSRFAWLAALLAASVSASHATPIDWHLYDASCAGGAAAVDIACGTYGRFMILQSTPPPGCTPRASGGEEPPVYPASPPATQPFPLHMTRLRDIAPQESPAGFTSLGPVSRWIAVVDFDDAHGESTSWLAGQIAGPDVTPALAPLDDPALDVLGPVGDFHVLARLCEIAQDVDGGALPAPRTVNMSFGRRVRATDPASSSSCPVQNAACQVAQVVHHVAQSGAWLVAAAGNHRDSLFPGALDEVVDAGMVDLNAFLAGIATRPAWETPPAAAATIPGYGLCLDAWPAPAGSSYSSALLSGWLVALLDHPDVLDQLGDGTWMPAWSPASGCYVLAKGRKATPWCNAAVTSIFAALLGPTQPGCGDPAAAAVTVSAGRATPPDAIPSIDTWGGPTHPEPESDPCVPCSGRLVATSHGSDLRIDMSESDALPGGIVLDQVALHVGTSNYVLGLTTLQLQQMTAGTLAAIVVPNGGALVNPSASISLWYRMKPDGSIDCASSPSCFWSSTPVLMQTSP